MIKVKFSMIHQWFFSWYLKRLMNKTFSHVWLVNELPKKNPDHALILTPNHISWWDGFIMYCVAKNRISGKGMLMMLEEQLTRHRFFSRIGAFSIDPGKPKSVFETIEYVRRLSRDPENNIVMYPQGKIEPYWKRPHDIQSGISRMLQREVPVDVIPVACCINTYNEKKPEIIIRFGEVQSSEEVISDFNNYKKKYHENLSLCDAAIISRDYQQDCLPF